MCTLFFVPCCVCWYEHSLKSIKPFESWNLSLRYCWKSLSSTLSADCNGTPTFVLEVLLEKPALDIQHRVQRHQHAVPGVTDGPCLWPGQGLWRQVQTQASVLVFERLVPRRASYLHGQHGIQNNNNNRKIINTSNDLRIVEQWFGEHPTQRFRRYRAYVILLGVLFKAKVNDFGFSFCF